MLVLVWATALGSVLKKFQARAKEVLLSAATETVNVSTCSREYQLPPLHFPVQLHREQCLASPDRDCHQGLQQCSSSSLLPGHHQEEVERRDPESTLEPQGIPYLSTHVGLPVVVLGLRPLN